MAVACLGTALDTSTSMTCLQIEHEVIDIVRRTQVWARAVVKLFEFAACALL